VSPRVADGQWGRPEGLRYMFLAVLATMAMASPVAGQHTGHDHGQKPPPQAPAAPDPHAQRRQGAAEALPSFIPPVTDTDRAAAFPDVHGHSVHDDAVNFFALADELEWQRGDGASSFVWKARGWVGKDRDRLWFRSSGEAEEGGLGAGSVEALYGRMISPWWDVVAGIRQDVRPGDPQTWAAIGLQGLAPYWFHVEATAYVGASGRTRFELETEYEVLLSNRLIVQPLVELDIYGKDDPDRGIGAGLSEIETGMRLRYEIRREFAPYIGVVWNQKLLGSADFAREAGERVSSARVAVGLRLWF
jgi:copper resistance protein B